MELIDTKETTNDDRAELEAAIERLMAPPIPAYCAPEMSFRYSRSV